MPLGQTKIVYDPGITQFLIVQARGIKTADLPKEVLEVFRHSVLDWFAVRIAGANEALVLPFAGRSPISGWPRMVLT